MSSQTVFNLAMIVALAILFGFACDYAVTTTRKIRERRKAKAAKEAEAAVPEEKPAEPEPSAPTKPVYEPLEFHESGRFLIEHDPEDSLGQPYTIYPIEGLLEGGEADCSFSCRTREEARLLMDWLHKWNLPRRPPQ